jgi:hypothetical protein
VEDEGGWKAVSGLMYLDLAETVKFANSIEDLIVELGFTAYTLGFPVCVR